MKNHLYHFIGGSLLGFVALESQLPVPGLDEAIKAVISIVAGVIGSIVTYYLNKWLVRKK